MSDEKSPELAGQAVKTTSSVGKGQFLLPHTMEKLYIGGRFHDTSRVLDVILGLHGLSVEMLLNCVSLPSSTEYCEKQDAIMRLVQISDYDSLDERRTKRYLQRELDQLLWAVAPLKDRQANYEAGLHSKDDYYS